MKNNILVTYNELPSNLNDYEIVINYNFNDHTIDLYNKGKLLISINDEQSEEPQIIEEEFGGTDNWGKDQYELNIGYKKGDVDYDSIYVDNIIIQEYSGEDNWCKCELINNNTMVKYTALTENKSSDKRIAYFWHSTPDDVLSKGSNAGKKVSKTWCVTVIQEGNPNIEEPIITPQEPEKPIEEPDAQINGDEIFNQLLLAFNTILYNDTSKYISKTNKSTVYQYLLDMFNIADAEWNKKANSVDSLFNKDLYFEPVDYRNSSINGNIQTYEAMQSWLIAMCLSELVPSSGALTNNQTELFKCAYQFGDKDLYKEGSVDNNANIIKEKCYGVKQDATLARFVASMIYAFNHDSKIDIINNCRKELKSSCITIDSFNLDNNPDSLSCKNFGYTFKSTTNIGYLINGDAIFGEAPGPFTTTSGYNPLNRKPNGQNSNLFYGANNLNDWYDYNYKMDVAIDKYVRENYNFYCNDNNTSLDRTQANIDAFNNQPKDIRQTVLESGIVPGCQDFMWHGKKRMKFTGVDKVPFHFKPNNNAGYIYMHKFELADDLTTEGNNIYEYVAPYYIESMPTLWYTNPQPANKLNLKSNNIHGIPTHEMKFLCRIRSIADDNRNFSYAKEYGRRRPLGAKEAGWTRNEQKQDSPLNGINKFYAAALCTDELSKYNNIMKKFKNGYDDTGGMYADDFPHDRPASWPSGHASQTWTPALYLCQMIADNKDLQDVKMDIIKRSYKIGSLRSVGRFHWNSDILYGRLYATMLLPILNATQNLRDEYNRVKSKLCNGVEIPELISYDNNSKTGSCTIINNNSLNSNQIKFEFTNESGSSITIKNYIRFILNSNNNIIRTDSLKFDNSNDLITINNDETKSFIITVTDTSYFGNKLSYTATVPNKDTYTSNILIYDSTGVSHTFKAPMLQMFDSSETFRARATYKVVYGSATDTPIINNNSKDISFTLRIYNTSGQKVKLNGEFYMFLDTIEDGKLTSDNTGKYGYDGKGLILEGGTAANVNSIIIENNSSKNFNITIPESTINKLSDSLSPKSRCYGHQGNIILYTYGRWPNEKISGGWQKGHISDFYVHGFIDENENGCKLINGSTHTLKITGVHTGSSQSL